MGRRKGGICRQGEYPAGEKNGKPGEKPRHFLLNSLASLISLLWGKVSKQKNLECSVIYGRVDLMVVRTRKMSGKTS